MKKLCALVIGHKKSSPGADNENQNLYEFGFNEDLPFHKRVEELDGVISKGDLTVIYEPLYK